MARAESQGAADAEAAAENISHPSSSMRTAASPEISLDESPRVANAVLADSNHPSYARRTVPEWRLCVIAFSDFADLLSNTPGDPSDEET